MSRQRAKHSTDSHRTPNLALRQVRETVSMSQGELARLIGFSPAYVQAVELGQRPASVEFAEKIREQTGAWPRCILESWTSAVDVNGNAYTPETYKRLRSRIPEKPIEGELQRFAEPLSVLLKGASMVGKTSLALSLIRDKLHEAAQRILVLDGVAEALEKQLCTAGKLTVGQIRQHPEIAELTGFVDDPERPDEEVVVLQHVRPAGSPIETLLENLVPICAACNRTSNDGKGTSQAATEKRRSGLRRAKHLDAEHIKPARGKRATPSKM